MDRCVVTIAVGKKYYLDLAENLLRSFLLWNNQLSFLLLTDNAAHYSQYQSNPLITIKQIDLSDDEKSFTSKFSLYDHTFAKENLFIDCDCLVYKDLLNIFKLFETKNFSAFGTTISSGHFFCDVPSILEQFGLSSLPKFVGSVYYFKKNVTAKKVFDIAHQLKSKYDELGFIRLRDKANEEPLFAVAMSMVGENAVVNDGSAKADLMYYEHANANVLTGYTQVYKPIKEISAGESLSDSGSPAILHFNGPFSDGYLYKKEVFRLNNQNKKLISVSAYLLFDLPNYTQKNIKKNFRPLYRLLFGNRSIKKSNRM